MTRTLGRYRLLRKLAAGGMGTVYAAIRPGPGGFNKVVAIKRLHPHLSVGDEFRARFAAEARVGAQLSHPNIVAVLEFDNDADDFYIVMEYVEGADLSRVIAARQRAQAGGLPPPQAALIARHVLFGLQAAHERGGAAQPVVHRDINPRNIMVSVAGEVKITDFGMALIPGHQFSRLGGLRGTVAYMSPEQARGAALDARTDLFSVGLVLFELLAGEAAYDGDSDMKVLEQARSGEVAVQSLIGLPSPLRACLSRSLAVAVDERYQSARQMLGDIDAYLDSLSRRPTPEEIGALAVEHATTADEIVQASSRKERRVTRAIVGGANQGAADETDRAARGPEVARRPDRAALAAAHAKLGPPRRSRLLFAVLLVASGGAALAAFFTFRRAAAPPRADVPARAIARPNSAARSGQRRPVAAVDAARSAARVARAVARRDAGALRVARGRDAAPTHARARRRVHARAGRRPLRGHGT